MNNLFTSKFHIGAISGIVKYIEKNNPSLTNPADGIAYILEYDCHYLELILRLIYEYVPDFVLGFDDELLDYCLLSRQKCLILIIAYLTNYNNYFDISITNVGLEIEGNLFNNLNEMRIKFGNFDIPLKKHADILRDWYHTKYRHAGFILWMDPVISEFDEFIA